jgi:prohibitin 1
MRTVGLDGNPAAEMRDAGALDFDDLHDIFEERQSLNRNLWQTSYRLRVVLGVLVALFFLAYLWRAMFISVPAGHAAVLWSRFGGGVVTTTTYGEGLHVIFPWDRMDIYDARVQEKRQEVSLLTRQGLAVSMMMTARFHVNFRQLPLLHQRFGPNYKEAAVWPELVSALRRVVGRYTPEQIYAAGEDHLLHEVADQAAWPVSRCFVTLDRVLLTKVVLPERVQNAVQEKLSEEQKVATYGFLLTEARLEAERRAVEARGIREFEERSGVKMLKWRSIEAAEKLALSPNAKVVVLGGAETGLPLVLNPDK